MAYVIKVSVSDTEDTATPSDVLSDVSNVTFERSNRGTESIRFTISRDHPRLSSLVLGRQIKVHDTVADADLARGIISGTFDLGDKESITVTCRGFITRLSDHVYPPEHIITGSLNTSKDRFVQSYDWRKVTSLTPADSTFDGKSLLSFKGDLASGVAGMIWRVNQGATNMMAWDVHTDSDEDSAGVIGPTGVDSSTDGHLNDPPFGANAVYEAPYLDFVTPSAIDAVVPTTWDRLRVGGYWNEDTEVQYVFSAHPTTATARSAVSGWAQISDPEGVGQDISGVATDRMAEVKFLLTPIARTGPQISVAWFMVTARSAIDNIISGTWSHKTVSDNITVGGKTLLSSIDDLADSYNLEYQMTVDGKVHLQSVPFDGQWVLHLDSSAAGFTLDETASNPGPNDTVTITKKGLDDPNHVVVSNWSPQISPTLTGTVITGASSLNTATVNKVSVGSAWGDDLRQTYTFVDGIHCNITKFAEDDTSMANYISMRGSGAGANATEVLVQDDSSQNTYGLRQRVLSINEQTMVGLKEQADDMLARYKDPIKSMTITVLKTPNNTYDFEPGDRVRVVSRKLKDHSNNYIELDLRIQRETRTFSDGIVKIELVLENNPARSTSFTSNIHKLLRRMGKAGSEAIKFFYAGTIETPNINSGSVQDFEQHTGWAPSGVSAWITEVQDGDGTAQWYSGRGGPITAEVVTEKPTSDGALIGIIRTSGTGSYAARIRFECWGTDNTIASNSSRS